MTFSRSLISVLMVLLLVVPVRAENISGDPVYNTETPKGYSMMGDLLIARPLLIGATLVGTVAFLISLPFSLASGSVASAGESLVLEPGREAFVRCLGCTRSGYGVKDQD